MEFTYQCKGTCSRCLHFHMDEQHIVTGLSYEGGCNGNLKGVAALCEGMKAEDIIARVEGTRCGAKNTSCPDHLAHALREALQSLSADQA